MMNCCSMDDMDMMNCNKKMRKMMKHCGMGGNRSRSCSPLMRHHKYDEETKECAEKKTGSCPMKTGTCPTKTTDCTTKKTCPMTSNTEENMFADKKTCDKKD